MIHDTSIAEVEPKSNEYFVKFTPIGSKSLDDVYVCGYNIIEPIGSEQGAWLHLLFLSMIEPISSITQKNIHSLVTRRRRRLYRAVSENCGTAKTNSYVRRTIEPAKLKRKVHISQSICLRYPLGDPSLLIAEQYNLLLHELRSSLL